MTTIPTTTTGQTTDLPQPNPHTRTTAWGVLGTKTDDTTTTDPRAAMDRAGLLGWNVHTRPLETATIIPNGDGHDLVNPLPITTHRATVRDTPTGTAVLGVVGTRYQVIQNEEYLPLFDAVLANEPGAECTAAGEIRGGQRTFVAIRVPALDTKVGGIDPVEMHLIGQNSHDGSSGFHFALTPVRLYCTNQLRGLREGKGVRDSWVVRHTRSYQEQLSQVKLMLAQARDWAGRFTADAEVLLRTTVSDAAFHDVVAHLYPAPGAKASKAAHTRHDVRMDTLEDLWRDSVTIPDEVRGTAWGMFNVVTEYVDHYQPAGVGRGYTVEQARADRNLIGRDEAIKGRAWDAVLELV